jgi:hypothetical protein
MPSPENSGLILLAGLTGAIPASIAHLIAQHLVLNPQGLVLQFEAVDFRAQTLVLGPQGFDFSFKLLHLTHQPTTSRRTAPSANVSTESTDGKFMPL